jgi:hypothetical protein
MDGSAVLTSLDELEQAYHRRTPEKFYFFTEQETDLSCTKLMCSAHVQRAARIRVARRIGVRRHFPTRMADARTNCCKSFSMSSKFT